MKGKRETGDTQDSTQSDKSDGKLEQENIMPVSDNEGQERDGTQGESRQIEPENEEDNGSVVDEIQDDDIQAEGKATAPSDSDGTSPPDTPSLWLLPFWHNY